jgi:tRNA-binding EMAP/Myf-like protein
MATIDDLQQLDIRVGVIREVEKFPEARKPAYKLTIDPSILIVPDKNEAVIGGKLY